MNLLGECCGALVLQWVGINDRVAARSDIDARTERKDVDHDQYIDIISESGDAASTPLAADVITLLIERQFRGSEHERLNRMRQAGDLRRIAGDPEKIFDLLVTSIHYHH